MFRFIAPVIALLAIALSTTSVNALLRGSLDQAENTAFASANAETVRSLATTTDFVPLSCNNFFSPCTLWTTKFGTKTVHTARLFIECGECVVMDHPGPVLTLNNGVDIRGKLQIIKSSSDPALIIKATMVVVQGELEMRVTKEVDGKPLVKFVLEGESNMSFTPILENRDACGGSQCSVGKKAITVAGGKVESKYCCAFEIINLCSCPVRMCSRHILLIVSPRSAI